MDIQLKKSGLITIKLCLIYFFMKIFFIKVFNNLVQIIIIKMGRDNRCL